MRNIFDQYSQPENRLTHALVSALAADRNLLMAFVKWITGQRPPTRRLTIVEQNLPGEEDANETDEASGSSLPDAWIHDGESWAVIIESKIESRLYVLLHPLPTPLFRNPEFQQNTLDPSYVAGTVT
jgi:hypothetical protein